MNYDSELSSEVSLSRILDEMLSDGTDFPLVVSFLKGHASSIPEIYRHSALVFDLYDIATHPERKDEPFLVENMHHLPKTDLYFALSMWALTDPGFAKEYKASGKPGADIVRDIHHSEGRFGRAGVPMDWSVLDDFDDFIEHLRKLGTDERNIASFLSNSYLARSALMAENFLAMAAGQQYVFLYKLMSRGEMSCTDSLAKVYADMLVSLMRQLLVFNQVGLFNWVASVFVSSFSRYGGHSSWDNAIFDALVCRMPKSLVEMLERSGKWGVDRVKYEEVVFEMNLVETQFDPLDLFLAIYAMGKCNRNGLKKTLEEMVEKVDLLEFFNLPFEWRALDAFTGKEAKKDVP